MAFGNGKTAHKQAHRRALPGRVMNVRLLVPFAAGSLLLVAVSAAGALLAWNHFKNPEAPEKPSPRFDDAPAVQPAKLPDPVPEPYRPYFYRSPIGIGEFPSRKTWMEFDTRQYDRDRAPSGIDASSQGVRGNVDPARFPAIAEEPRIPARPPSDSRKNFAPAPLVKEWLRKEATRDSHPDGVVEPALDTPGRCAGDVLESPTEITRMAEREQPLPRQIHSMKANRPAEAACAEDWDRRYAPIEARASDDRPTSRSVDVHAGYWKKTGGSGDSPDDDRHANLAYRWAGIHGEDFIDGNWNIGAEFDREFFDMRAEGVENVGANRLTASVAYEGNSNIGVRGELAYRDFLGVDDIDDQVLYDVRVEFRELGGAPLDVGLFARRREHYDNWRNVYDNLHSYDFGVDGVYRRGQWDFDGRLRGAALSDGNSRFDLDAALRYRLVETPRMTLRIGGDFEYQDWKLTRPSYYSPQNMYQAGVTVDGRYRLSRDSEARGEAETYVDFTASINLDRRRNIGHKMTIGFNHERSDRFSVFARAGYVRESHYREFNLFGGLQYRFGGRGE